MKRLIFMLIMGLLSGCTYVDRYVGKAESMMNKEDACDTHAVRHGQSYTTEQKYRCVGQGCEDYGCRVKR